MSETDWEKKFWEMAQYNTELWTKYCALLDERAKRTEVEPEPRQSTDRKPRVFWIQATPFWKAVDSHPSIGDTIRKVLEGGNMPDASGWIHVREVLDE